MVATDGQTGGGYDEQNVSMENMGKKNVMSAQLLEVSPLGAGTVLRLETRCLVNGQITNASNK